MSVSFKISGCTPEIMSNLLRLDSQESYGPIVTSMLKALADPHKLSSQDDLCVIGAVHPSGRPYTDHVGKLDPPVSDLDPNEDVHVLPHCVMGDMWDFVFIVAPPSIKQDWCYLVLYGCHLMVQTYMLDIMALATHGRMTPFRLWRLAMEQGFEPVGRPHCLKGVDYGAITGQWEQIPDEFPGFTTMQLMELEKIGDVKVIKQRMVNEGYF
ncbi:hypothetical protein OG21DRAFT_1563475 [Imleria badia]|nr:hypothetical protein OG21DRAFT_1563475 [Imleria badia]